MASVYTPNQKEGLIKIYHWFESIVYLNPHLQVNHAKYVMRASVKDCKEWLFYKLKEQVYSDSDKEVLNGFRLLYLKNKGVMIIDDLILDTAKL